MKRRVMAATVVTLITAPTFGQTPVRAGLWETTGAGHFQSSAAG